MLIRKLLLLLLLGSFLGLSHVVAHDDYDDYADDTVEDADTDVNVDPNIDNPLFGENFGGYGYLSNTEADAARVLDFDCFDDNQRQYHGRLCGQTTNPQASLSSLVDNSMRTTIYNRLREQAVEYYMLQNKVINPTNPYPLSNIPESCLSADSPIRQRLTAGNGDPVNRGRTLVFKDMYSPLNLGKASLYHERLKHGYDVNGCNKASKKREMRCINISNQLYRLRASYPILYPGTTLGGDPLGVADFGMQRNDQRHADLQVAIKDLLKENGNSETFYNEKITTKESRFYPDVEQAFQDAYIAASKANPGSNLDGSKERFDYLVSGFRNDYNTITNGMLTMVCSGSPGGAPNSQQLSEQIFKLGIANPNIIRQALLDMNPREREMSKLVLCQSNNPNNESIMDWIRPKLQCNGISGGPLPENSPVKLTRWHSFEWPYGAQQYFEMHQDQTPPGENQTPRPIKMKMDLKIKLQGNLNANSRVKYQGQMITVAQLKQRWQDDLNGYFNCQTGARSSFIQNIDGQAKPMECPPGPGMRRTPNINFEINLDFTTEEKPKPPVVNLHTCFHGRVPGEIEDKSNCSKVKKQRIDECYLEQEPDENLTRSECRARVNAMTRKQRNRQNSGNYTTDISIGTLRHEIAHQFGAPDEYQDEVRPFSIIGNHDSIMRRSRNQFETRLYPRHLDKFMEPLRCIRYRQRENEQTGQVLGI